MSYCFRLCLFCTCFLNSDGSSQAELGKIFSLLQSLSVLGTSAKSELKSEECFCWRESAWKASNPKRRLSISRLQMSALSARVPCSAILDSGATSVHAVKQFNIVKPPAHVKRQPRSDGWMCVITAGDERSSSVTPSLKDPIPLR